MSYEAQTKEELLAEVGKRKLAGRILEVSQQDKKEDIVSALSLDDEAQENAKTSMKSSGIPVIEPKVNKETGVPDAGGEITPTEYSGIYINSGDKEPYGLAIVKDAPDGRTHFAKNSLHFWNGSEADFKLLFDKQ